MIIGDKKAAAGQVPPHCIVFFYFLLTKKGVFVFALFVAFFVCSLRIGSVSVRYIGINSSI